MYVAANAGVSPMSMQNLVTLAAMTGGNGNLQVSPNIYYKKKKKKKKKRKRQLTPWHEHIYMCVIRMNAITLKNRLYRLLLRTIFSLCAFVFLVSNKETDDWSFISLSRAFAKKKKWSTLETHDIEGWGQFEGGLKITNTLESWYIFDWLLWFILTHYEL